MDKGEDQEKVYNSVCSEIIRATYFSHCRKKNSFKKESKAAEISQKKEKPQEIDKKIG
jgi:hypothetical protein